MSIIVPPEGGPPRPPRPEGDHWRYGPPPTEAQRAAHGGCWHVGCPTAIRGVPGWEAVTPAALALMGAEPRWYRPGGGKPWPTIIGECAPGTHPEPSDALACGRCRGALQRATSEAARLPTWTTEMPPVPPLEAPKQWAVIDSEGRIVSRHPDHGAALRAAADGDHRGSPHLPVPTDRDGWQWVGGADGRWVDTPAVEVHPTTTRVELTPEQMRRLEAAGWTGGDDLAEWLTGGATLCADRGEQVVELRRWREWAASHGATGEDGDMRETLGARLGNPWRGVRTDPPPEGERVVALWWEDGAWRPASLTTEGVAEWEPDLWLPPPPDPVPPTPTRADALRMLDALRGMADGDALEAVELLRRFVEVQDGQ